MRNAINFKTDLIEKESVPILTVKEPPKPTSKPSKPGLNPNQNANKVKVNVTENLSLLRASSGVSKSQVEKPFSKTALLKGKTKFQPTIQTKSFQIHRSVHTHKFYINQYQLEHELGKGAFGSVFSVFDTETKRHLAMKTISRTKMIKTSGLFSKPPPRCSMTARRSSVLTRGFGSSSNSRTDVSSNKNGKSRADISDPMERVLAEINIHSRLNHPNIIGFLEVLTDKNKDELHFIFELAELGPVFDVDLDHPLNEIQARCYFRDVVLGLEYLHNRGVIHRDIKPDNLLLCADGHVKISDFGVSCEFLSEEDVFFSDTVGSPAFLAPEVVNECESKFNGKALDIWALGVTLYAFLFAMMPFRSRNRNDLYHDIANEPLDMPLKPDVSPEAREILDKLLTKDPDLRIKMDEIKIHEWTTFKGAAKLPRTRENCVKGDTPEPSEYVRRFTLFTEEQDSTETRKSSIFIHEKTSDDNDDSFKSNVNKARNSRLLKESINRRVSAFVKRKMNEN